LARICRKVVRKRYYEKSSYEYVTLWLYLPRRLHEILEPYINQKLDIYAEKRNGKLQLTLDPKPSKP
jgi:hypothetical protein